MATPTVSRSPRAIPDHWEEHVRLAQWADVDKPQGIVAYKNGTATSVAMSATLYTAFTLTNVPMKANRFYLITFILRAWQNTTTAGYLYLILNANGVAIGNCLGYLGANQWYSSMTWCQPYIITADATITFTATLTGPAGSSIWLDRGGQLRIEDKGKDRGGTIQ